MPRTMTTADYCRWIRTQEKRWRLELKEQVQVMKGGLLERKGYKRGTLERPT